MRRLLGSRVAPIISAVAAAGRMQSGSGGGRNAAEDQDELERERRLREQFSRKMAGNAPPPPPPNPFEMMQNLMRNAQAVNPTNNTQGSQGNQNQDQSNQQQQQQQQQQRPNANFANALLYGTAFYSLFILYQLGTSNSLLNSMQGVPAWTVPIDSLFAYHLVRMVLPAREVSNIKNAYAEALKVEPALPFGAFLARNYPTVLTGNATSQPEIIAAVCSCYAATHNMAVLNTIRRAVGRQRDTRAIVDSIADALRREYPQVFQGMSRPSIIGISPLQPPFPGVPQMSPLAPFGQPPGTTGQPVHALYPAPPVLGTPADFALAGNAPPPMQPWGAPPPPQMRTDDLSGPHGTVPTTFTPYTPPPVAPDPFRRM